MNKRGGFTDVIFVIGLMLFMSISLVFGIYISSILISTVAGTGLGGSEYADFAILMTSQLSQVDWFLGFGIILFVLMSLYSAHKVEVGKGVFVLYMVFAVVLAFAGNFIKDVWDVFASADVIASTVASMNFIPFLMSNIVFISVFYSLAMLIALISRPAEPQVSGFFGGGEGGFRE